MNTRLPDAHTHPHASGTGYRFICCAAAQDMPQTAALAAAEAEVVPFFGIHPWHIQEQSWQTHLAQVERFLQAFPRAGIGETGLDKCRRGIAPFTLQKEVLHAHLQLAQQYERPITLHCCRAWGSLAETLTAYPGIKVILHGWTGAIPLKNLPSHSLLSVGLREATRPGLIKSISPHMLVLESDGKPDTLPQLYRLAATELDISTAELVDLITKNMRRITIP